ncbi:MAG: intein-containing recombinase RecA, partial [Actinomycetota bacterium]|nr:intein-containing recombinase RecA [Actinomycetota bacterium]
LQVQPVTSWFDQGEQPVIEIAVKGGAELTVTPDHQVLTDRGWRLAGDLRPGDRVARPREFLGFGSAEPMPADHARLLGYLIGDGYVGGKTPISFTNVVPELHADAARIAATLGCHTKQLAQEISVAFSHRPGEKNGVLELCREAGIWGKLAWEKQIPPVFFAPDVSADVVSNLLFGLLETDGYVGAEQTGALRVGFTTTSEQIAHQIHWLLLRWGVGSTVRRYDPTGQRASLIRGRRVQAKRECFEVRVTGIENVSALGEALPSWGPRSGLLATQLANVDLPRHRGSQRMYLAAEMHAPVLAHLKSRRVTARSAAQLIGDIAGSPAGGMRQVLGSHRLRRDRVTRLADALDDAFLHEVLADQLAFSAVRSIRPGSPARTFDVEVADLHNLVAEDIVVHNCAAPFRQAEFDILYNHGISREGGLIDMGVEHGLVRKSGAWYTYEGDQLGQGKENARKFLLDNPDLSDEIEKRIKEKLGIGARLDVDADLLAPAPVDF